MDTRLLMYAASRPLEYRVLYGGTRGGGKNELLREMEKLGFAKVISKRILKEHRNAQGD